ncbi:MAG: carboxypeptidase regulatory-like domain-containing protein, partial [Crocinitomicaceae bacterium]
MKRMRFLRFGLLFLLLLIGLGGNAQRLLTGVITDETNSPIPFARVYVKNDADLRVQADVNGVYEMRLFEGEYFLVISSMGYQDRESYIVINSVDTTRRDIQLFPAKVQELEAFELVTKRTNPGRDIMMKVVEKRDQINPWNLPHTVDVYIKASEKITRTGKEKDKDKDEEVGQIEDPFEAEKKKIMAAANDMNLLEVQIQRNFSPPAKVKEFRNAYTLRGNDKQLYYTTTVKSNFNFFQNLIHLNDLHQSPVSSPISTPGILSYKYKLEAQYMEEGRKIHKIKIIARNTATTTLTGYIYVIDSVWLIQKLDLTMEKGNLLKYDYFRIEQTFSQPG